MKYSLLLTPLIFLFNLPSSYSQNSSSNIDWDDLGVDPDYARFLQKNQELYDELFITRNYRSDLSPIFNQAAKNNSIPRFNVVISLEFIQLLGVDAQSQMASTAMEIDYAYADPRLAWNPENYGGIDMINVESKSIWIPANGISNAQTLQVVYPDPLNTANIYANGSVAVSFQLYAETRCVMDVKNFPFDEQSCTIDIFNNAYTLDMVQETGALFTKYVDGIIFDNGEWKFKNVSLVYFDFSGTGRDKYDFIQFVLNIKREPNFYVFVIVVPCFLLTLLSIWGMFWTLNNREEQLSKLSIGLTSMMSMTIFVQMLSEEIPRNSSFPLLGWFVIIDVGLVSLACVILVTLPFEKAKNVTKEVDGLEGIRKWSPFLRNWLISRHFFIFFTFQMANYACCYAENLAGVNWTEIGVADDYANFLTKSQELYNELFVTRGYRNDLAPIYFRGNQDDSIPKFDVLISLQFIQLLEMNAQSQMASISMEIDYDYKDARLAWNPENYDGIERINVQSTSIWIPANGISNAQTLEVVYPDQFNTATIYANGTVSVSLQYYAETRCVMNVKDFPFDEQLCSIDMFNNAYDYQSIKQSGALFTKYKEGTIYDNGEWSFRNITVWYELFNGTGAVKYDFLQFYLDLKREPTFYVFVIVVPCFLLTLLSIWGMFWTENDQQEQLSKLSIGLTSMMSMTIFVQMLSEAIPRNTTFPLLGWFVIIDVGLVSLACVVLVTLPFEEGPKPEKPGIERSGVSLWMSVIVSWVYSRHFFIFFIFQVANLANFVVFFAHWD